MRKTLLLSTALFVLSGCSYAEKTSIVAGDAIERPVQQSFIMGEGLYDRAYADADVDAREGVIGGIIPHHLLASHLIARFFEGISGQPQVVVLIGPNHREVGNYGIVTSEASWDTPYGVVSPNEEIISALVTDGLAKVDERVFAGEHSISAEVPFIKKSIPNTSIVPIVVKTRVPQADLDALAERLHEILPENSLVLASVDFAHYVTSDIADQQDQASLKVLQDFAIDRLNEAYVDSPASLRVVMKYLEARNATDGVLVENSNSAKVTGDASLSEVTSYITMYFVQ